MNSMVFSRRLQAVVLPLLCIAILVSHFLYVSKSRQYPQWDEHHYLSEAVSYYDILRSGEGSWYQRILAESSYRQPVYGLLLSALLFIFGTNHTYKVALLFNGMLYVATILSVYFLARSFMSKTASLMAAIIFTFYGNSLFFLHFTYSETALTAIVTATVLFLWKSDDFTRSRESFITAILFGLSNLIKWSAPAFVALPFAFVGIRAVIRAARFSKQRTRILCHMLLVLLVGVAIPISVYYLPNWEPFIAYVKRNQSDGPQWVTTYRFADMANTFSVHSLVYYSNIISQNTVYFFILFLAGTFVSLRYLKRYAYLLLAFVSQYGFLTLFAVWKEDRYAVSMYPFMALLSALVFVQIRWRKARDALIAVTIILAVLNFLGASWGIGPMGKRGLTDVVLPEFIKHPRRIYLTPLVWPPNREYVNAHRLFELINSNPAQNRPARVLQMFVYEPWDNAVMSISSYEKRGEIAIQKIERNDPDFFATVDESDYVLTKNEELSFVEAQYLALMPKTKLLDIIYVPIDGSRVYVYRVNL